MMKPSLLLSMGLLFLSATAQKKNKIDPMVAQLNTTKNETITFLNNRYDLDKKTALQIWDFAEVGYKENKSAALHVQHLKEAGFKVETGVALSLIHI